MLVNIFNVYTDKIASQQKFINSWSVFTACTSRLRYYLYIFLSIYTDPILEVEPILELTIIYLLHYIYVHITLKFVLMTSEMRKY